MKIIKGCPICKADIYGTKETGYYCKHCNILFESKYVNYQDIKEQLREKINKHFGEVDTTHNKTCDITPNVQEHELRVFEHKTINHNQMPERISVSKKEQKEIANIRSMDAVKSLRKIDGYGKDDEKPAILQMIVDHLKKYKTPPKKQTKKIRKK